MLASRGGARRVVARAHDHDDHEPAAISSTAPGDDRPQPGRRAVRDRAGARLHVDRPLEGGRPGHLVAGELAVVLEHLAGERDRDGDVGVAGVAVDLLAVVGSSPGVKSSVPENTNSSPSRVRLSAPSVPPPSASIGVSDSANRVPT